MDAVKLSINQNLMNEIYIKKILKKNKAKENNISKNKIKIDFNNETNEISNDTFNNFKTLQKILKNQVFSFNYDQIYQKMQEASVGGNDIIFDYSAELKRIENEKQRGIGVEDELLEKYMTIVKEIKQKLNLGEQIRMINYMNYKKINTQKENVVLLIV